MKARKEITFDLILDELKEEFGETNFKKGYDEISNFLCKINNFEHRQCSVYCSNEEITSADVVDLIMKLKEKCPWLNHCLRRMDVANVENLHELTEILKANN